MISATDKTIEYIAFTIAMFFSISFKNNHIVYTINTHTQTHTHTCIHIYIYLSTIDFTDVILFRILDVKTNFHNKTKKKHT